MLEDLSPEVVHQAMDRVVDELLQAAGVHEPPVNAIHLAQRHLAIEVVKSPSGGKGTSRSRNSPGIVLDPGQSEEQHQWTAAQGIGNHLRHTLLEALHLDEEVPSMTRATLVKMFAPRLLAPASWLRSDFRTLDQDLLALKERYATASYEVLALRLLDLPDPCIITIVDNDHVSRRRSNTWRVQRTLEPPEQECQRYVHHYSRAHTVHSDGWTVQGWPIHRPDWKREILRSVVEMDF